MNASVLLKNFVKVNSGNRARKQRGSRNRTGDGGVEADTHTHTLESLALGTKQGVIFRVFLKKDNLPQLLRKEDHSERIHCAERLFTNKSDLKATVKQKQTLLIIT